MMSARFAPGMRRPIRRLRDPLRSFDQAIADIARDRARDGVPFDREELASLAPRKAPPMSMEEAVAELERDWRERHAPEPKEEAPPRRLTLRELLRRFRRARHWAEQGALLVGGEQLVVAVIWAGRGILWTSIFGVVALGIVSMVSG